MVVLCFPIKAAYNILFCYYVINKPLLSKCVYYLNVQRGIRRLEQ